MSLSFKPSTVFRKTENQAVTPLLVCLKNYSGSTEKGGGCKQYEPSFVFTH